MYIYRKDIKVSQSKSHSMLWIATCFIGYPDFKQAHDTIEDVIVFFATGENIKNVSYHTLL